MTNSIKYLRKAKGLTQIELAEISGVPRSIINQLENGKKDVITSDTMVKICNALETPLGCVFHA